MTQFEVRLTQDQIDFYHQNGFLKIGAITTPAEVEWTKEVYDRLFASDAGQESGDQFDLAGKGEERKMLPQILGPHQYVPELEQTQFRRNAAIIAAQLLGPESDFIWDHAIMKPPQYGAATPWHQDEAYFNPAQIHNNLSVWIPLQEATVENGCMQFIPGSHEEVLAHHHIGHDPDVPGLEIDQIEPENAVACPIPAGGATIHNCRTLHYAGPNLSDIPRRAYVLIFGTPTLERDIPRDFPWRNKK